MTNYSPLMDAIEEKGQPVTPSDMEAIGYDDFERGKGTSSIRMHVLQALYALDGEIFNDPAKWRTVNELVAALVEMDELDDIDTEVSLRGQDISISFEPKRGGHL